MRRSYVRSKVLLTREQRESLEKLITEDYLRGVPTWALREEVDEFVNAIGQHIKRFIVSTPNAETHVQTQQAIDAMDKVLKELEEEVFQLLEDKLWSYTRQI